MRPFFLVSLLLSIAIASGKPVVIALIALVALLAYLRYGRAAKRRRATESLLRAVGSRPEGIVARPGVTRFMSDDLWPKAEQWKLVSSMPKLFSVMPRPGAPRHYPPDVNGLIVRLTDEGRDELRRIVGASRHIPTARTVAH